MVLDGSRTLFVLTQGLQCIDVIMENTKVYLWKNAFGHEELIGTRNVMWIAGV